MQQMLQGSGGGTQGSPIADCRLVPSVRQKWHKEQELRDVQPACVFYVQPANEKRETRSERGLHSMPGRRG